MACDIHIRASGDDIRFYLRVIHITLFQLFISRLISFYLKIFFNLHYAENFIDSTRALKSLLKVIFLPSSRISIVAIYEALFALSIAHLF